MKGKNPRQTKNKKDRLADETRRDFLKLSAAAVAAPALLRAPASEAAVPILPPSPATTPWVMELPKQIVPAAAAPSLTPAPTELANLAGGEAGRSRHQRWTQFRQNAEYYELRAQERDWMFNPAYPKQKVWAYRAANTPDKEFSATVMAHYGRSMICRIHNELPSNHTGFGTPEISTHLHNLHTGSESDGFPGDYYSATKAGPTLTASGKFKDHLYPNVCAGFENLQDSIGDYREALGTLFYHDHTLDFTAPNLYRGLVGFYLLYDHLDSGNEADPTPGALRLPSHPYDYPLMFADRRFDAGGMLYYDEINPEGVLGDKVLVNGMIEPVLKVAARRYRFRLLNTGPSLFYAFSLVNSGNLKQNFTYIGNDGNLLPQPLLNQQIVTLGVAERGDIVVDFSKYPVGTTLYLVNRMRQEETRGPKDIRDTGVRVLKIVVDRWPTAQDLSQVPAYLRPLPPLDPYEVANAPVRRFVFERSNNMWVINGQFVNVTAPRFTVPKGRGEIWELVNIDNGWSHPIHIHFEEGRIIARIRNGVSQPIPAHEQGRKDVYVLNRAETVRIFIRFRDYVGKYVMHCHNLIHEDHAMMLRFDIE
ncbi:twin-arginine translocation signal domain-containing protein [Pseudomonas sp. BN417]|uniref:multicopper oxidase family protein n=1 Tax=Pseudomonas sp. BN417 TaxID=2567890 RepID=UPI002456A988|nr:multicopper oxidase domain-containing protein [Pseudomonas sp. BN417]MDH4557960.1 twin-arginine translocation signal domain-containing protein [Pseudomonas sp. BN417]